VVIPSSVKTIGQWAFNECHKLKEIVISEGVKEICKSAFRCCHSLCELFIPSSVNTIGNFAFGLCSSLEIVHLPAEVSNIEMNSFKDCNNLKAIYVPKNNVDFYKERFPADMHWLIVEEGSELPVKSESFIAKDISFASTFRVIVPKGEGNDYILSAAKKKLESLGIHEIVKLIFDNIDNITDSQKPYGPEDQV
jgi:hypothetical protein